MKVFVFGYDRYETMTTSDMLEADGVDHQVLVHTDEARDLFVAAGHVRPDRIVVTGNPRGLAYQRNAALDLMERGEWAVFLVDDLRRVTEVRDSDTRGPRLGITMDNQRDFAGQMYDPLTLDRFMVRAEETAAACDRVGARLGGFCGIANPVFRDAHWRFNVLADGRAWVIRKDKLRFDENVHTIDDICWTARNIQAYGVTLVNQWVLPDCRRYSAGGYGSIADRTPQKLDEIRYLTATYPRLIRVADKAGHVRGSHAVLRRTLRPAQLRSLESAAVG